MQPFYLPIYSYGFDRKALICETCEGESVGGFCSTPLDVVKHVGQIEAPLLRVLFINPSAGTVSDETLAILRAMDAYADDVAASRREDDMEAAAFIRELSDASLALWKEHNNA